jgi:hypothetical protein
MKPRQRSTTGLSGVPARLIRACVMVSLVITAIPVARPLSAQEATERFIPIGQSPGVSGVLSYIGEIESRDVQANTVTVTGADGSRTFTLTDSTRIWIDRSSQQATNLMGERDALQVGTRIEVKFPSQERPNVAEWIKVAG